MNRVQMLDQYVAICSQIKSLETQKAKLRVALLEPSEPVMVTHRPKQVRQARRPTGYVIGVVRKMLLDANRPLTPMEVTYALHENRYSVRSALDTLVEHDEARLTEDRKYVAYGLIAEVTPETPSQPENLS